MAGPMTLEEFDRQLSSRLGGGVADPSLPPIPSLTGREPGQEFGPELADPSVSSEDVFVKAQQRVRDTQAPPSAAITSSATGQGSGQSEQEMMDILIKARGRLSGERGQVRGFGTPLDAIRYLARSGVNLAGFLATPIIDPITRSGMTEEQKAEDAQLPVGQRLAASVGRSQEAARGLLQYIGITPENTPEESETIFGRIGEDLIPAALAALAVTRGAPYVARMATYSGRLPLIARIGRGAETIATHPVTTATGIIGTQPSGTTLRELASPTGAELFGEGKSWPSWAGRFLWDLTTETIGGGLTSGLVRRATRPLMPRAERFTPFATPSAPIIDRATNPVEAAGLMRVQAATSVDAIDRMVADAIDTVNRTGLNPVDAGEVFRGGLLAARDFAKEQADAAYAALPRHLITGTPTRLLEGAQQQLGRVATFVAESDNFASDYLREIIEQLGRRGPGGRPVIDPLTGQRQFRDIVSLDELISIRSRLDHMSRDAAEINVKSTQGNRVLKANLDDLHARLTDDIETGLRNLDPRYFAQWELANEMYRVYNQRFRQGPVGELLMSTRHNPLPSAGTPMPPGAALIPDAKVTAKLLQPDETADAVYAAVQPFFPNAIPPGAAGQGARVAGTAGTRAEDAIRSMFEHQLRAVWEAGQEVAKRPQGAVGIPGLQYNLAEAPVRGVVGKAERFINEHEPLLRQWTRLTTDMVQTQADLARLLARRNEYTQSLVYQFLGRKPADVISDAITSPNRQALFQQLYDQFRAHPQALEGMRRALIDYVFAGHGVDPTEALARLTSTELEPVFRIMFQGAEDRLARLYDTTRAASDIIGDIVRSTASGAARLDEKGAIQQMGLIRRGIRASTVNMAGWFLGLMPAHNLVRLLGLGSQGALSVPARFSSFFRDVTAATWISKQVKALDAIRDAVFDPRLEAWMMNSTDHSWRGQLHSFKQMESLVRATQRSMNEDVEEYLNGNARRKAREDRARAVLELRRSRENPFK